MAEDIKLDFSGLFSEPPPEKAPSKTPSEQHLEQGEYKTPTQPEKQAEGLTEGLGALQRKADQNKAQIDHSLEVYRKYQENTVKSGQLQTDILKGATAGESIYTLFLKAVQAISLMTSNPLFYSQLQEDIVAIYGAGLLEPEPLKMELEAVEGRLRKLREASTRGEPDYNQRNIARAIQAHEQRAGELRDLIARGGESVTA